MWIWLGNVQIKVISTWSKGVVLYTMIGGKEGERSERGKGKEWRKEEEIS